MFKNYQVYFLIIFLTSSEMKASPGNQDDDNNDSDFGFELVSAEQHIERNSQESSGVPGSHNSNNASNSTDAGVNYVVVNSPIVVVNTLSININNLYRKPLVIPSAPDLPREFRGFRMRGRKSGIRANLQVTGQLNFQIETLEGHTPRGRFMFAEMIQAIGDNVLAIQDYWVNDKGVNDNYQAFYNNLNHLGVRSTAASQNQLALAAANTFTGKMATRFGYQCISCTVDEDLKTIEVLFSWPEQDWLDLGLEPPDVCRGNRGHFHFDPWNPPRGSPPPAPIC